MKRATRRRFYTDVFGTTWELERDEPLYSRPVEYGDPYGDVMEAARLRDMLDPQEAEKTA